MVSLIDNGDSSEFSQFQASILTGLDEFPPAHLERIQALAMRIATIITKRMASKMEEAGEAGVDDPSHLYMACLVEYLAHIQISFNDLLGLVNDLKKHLDPES